LYLHLVQPFYERRLMVSRIASAAATAALFSVLLAAFGSVSPRLVFAQDQRLESLVNRLDRIERDLGTLSRQVYRGEAPAKGAAPFGPPPSGDIYGRIEARLQQIESELATLTGNVETLTHANSETGARIERLQKDLEFRLSEIERGGAPRATAGAQSAPAPAAFGSPGATSREGVLGTLTDRDTGQRGAPTAGAPAPDTRRAALPQGTPQQQYDYALSLLSKSDYNGAASAFQEFLDKNPTTPLASNARYWLGESHYVRKDYNSAARIFLDGYTKDQRGPKAPDSLLKLGMSLTNLEKKKEACATFDKLTKDFPDAATSIKQRLPAERKRAGCG
jgi:tol-pal system protein YbgF